MKTTTTDVWLVCWPRSDRPTELRKKLCASPAAVAHQVMKLRLSGRPEAQIEVWRAIVGPWTRESAL